MPPTHDILQLLVLGMAAARITSLLVTDDITESLRHIIFMWSPPYDSPELGRAYQTYDFRSDSQRAFMRKAGFVGRLVSCYHCTAVWVAAALYIMQQYDLPSVSGVIAIAAIAQIAELTIKISRGDK